MIKNRFDQHIHSSFSYDAERGITLSKILETAMAKGLAGVAITDHLDPIWPDEEDPSFLDVPAYETALNEAESLYADKIRFARGIELGFLPGEALAICEDVVSAYPYDFVIGSVHNSATAPIEKPVFQEGRSRHDSIDDYYSLIIDSIRVYKNYDILGHINCIDRYTDGFAEEDEYMPYADEIMKILVADGKGLEINTSSFRYNIGARGTPTPAILARFKELGGEIITIGSDAHCIPHIGTYIEYGERMLLAAGFKYLAVFSKRQPDFIKL